MVRIGSVVKVIRVNRYCSIILIRIVIIIVVLFCINIERRLLKVVRINVVLFVKRIDNVLVLFFFLLNYLILLRNIVVMVIESKVLYFIYFK